MLKLLFKAKRYMPQLICVIVLLFVIAMCDLMLPRLMANLINNGIADNNMSFVYSIGLQMLGISLFSVLCHIISNYLSSLSSMGFGRDLRSEAYHKITRLSLQQADEYGTASLITRTSSDVREMQMVVQIGLRSVVSVPLHMIGGIVMALTMDVKLAMVVVVAMPLLLAIIYININWVRPLFITMRDKLDSVSRVLREILSGVRVIRAFNTIETEHNRFNDTNMEYTNANKKARHRMAMIHPFTTIVISGATVAVYWFGQFRIEAGAMSAGDIMAFSQYVMQILGSVMNMQMIFNLIPRAMISATRLNEVLDTTPLITEPKNPKTPEPGIRGEVRFENVTFKYPGAEKSVLEDISFVANPGETTAIIGGTGSGKSTIVSLIPRLYDIQGGKILIDRTDITEMAHNDLRGRIGFIPQKAQLFTGSISENIKYGKYNATDEEIKNAAVVAQADEFIDTLSEGYDSFVSQDATNLSGGQKQRISIARAIVRNPEIYIFDDSFSALDFKTDADLRAALKPVTSEAAVIIVAQRVSTIMDADRIVVLDEGKCVGQGTHAELMKSCVVYREIVYSQLKEEEIA